jgi:formylglycine-generating enzyme required for sulfatase activity/uncharacterized caspase-like protein
MRLALIIASFVLATVLAVVPGHADKRVALVIGNGAYQHADKLGNPVTDARRMRDALAKLEFDVVFGENLGKQALERTIGRFANMAQDANVAMVFFAGHGATFGDTPYVVPIDAQFSSLGEMPYELVPVETLIGELRRAKGLRIAILDACRDNTAERKLKQAGSRGGEVTRGLARVKNPEGLILAYATQYLSTAADGDPHGDSPFTAALLNHIATPGLDVKDLFFKVGSEVIASTKGGQRPEISVSFYDSYALVPAGQGATVAPSIAPPPQEPAAQAWAAVKDTTSQSVLEDFIRRYGDSIYGTLARARMEELKRSQVAAVAPPVTPGPATVEPAVIVPPTVLPDASGPCGGGVVTVSLSSRCATPLSDAEERALKPKDRFKECDNCPEMMVVPAGEFAMGAPDPEPERESTEGPRHRVAISRPFAVGRYAVTFDEWGACIADGGCNGYKPWDNGWGRGRRPVINVSWDDAKSYVAWLSRKSGKIYRLPSEAEREYATRAGTNTAFWWGTAISPRQANYNGVNAYNRGAKGEQRQKTIPVDSFEPNPWGLYQVHGNVWEWLNDCLNENYRGAPSDGSAWETGNCSRHMLRGGSWVSNPGLLRSAARYGVNGEGRVGNVGFRVARTLTP